MNLKNEFDPIKGWAIEKGIIEKSNTEKQFIKLQEEIGELASSILKNDNEEFIDAIGDCIVVLTILAQLKGFNVEDCINSAYNIISYRKGKMINGAFIKE